MNSQVVYEELINGTKCSVVRKGSCFSIEVEGRRYGTNKNALTWDRTPYAAAPFETVEGAKDWIKEHAPSWPKGLYEKKEKEVA